ncbi:glycosyltransferase [Arthrobacter rhombi]|uniref:glycosyltransferase n=1 Tax=Arthrobacter rhombi TaxID=71253 RepID=UPI003FD346CB
MRILQIATLVSPENTYGGPIRVAVNQLRSLAAEGHEVLLVAGATGFSGDMPTEYEGVPVLLFQARKAVPGIGFAGLAAPGMLLWLVKNARSFDAVHIHLARDLVTMPAALFCRLLGRHFVVQTHGMIDLSKRKLSGVLDAVATIRVLRTADKVFYLTANELEDLKNVGGALLRTEFLPNGVPANEESGPRELQVLYLARLQERKRPELFVELAVKLHVKYPEIRFVLVGPDEGSGDVVQQLIEAHAAYGYVEWVGPEVPTKTLEWIRKSQMLVLPSVNEPFPMSVLEALSVGCPAVVSTSCGLASYLESSGAGLVFDESFEDLVETVDAALADPVLLKRMSGESLKLARDRFDMTAISLQLLESYSASSKKIH